MDWKQFMSSLVGSLAWPIVIFAFLFLYRIQLRHLLSQVRRIGAGGVSVELAVERALNQAEDVEVEEDTAPPDVALDPATLELVQRDPQNAFLKEFKGLENVILQIRSNIPDKRPHRTLNEVLRNLNTRGLISGSVIGLFERLREVRNAVVHATEFNMTPNQAIELVRQIRLLTNILHRAKSDLQAAPKG